MLYQYDMGYIRSGMGDKAPMVPIIILSPIENHANAKLFLNIMAPTKPIRKNNTLYHIFIMILRNCSHILFLI